MPEFQARMPPDALAMLSSAAVLYGAGTFYSRRLRRPAAWRWRSPPRERLDAAALRAIRADAENAALAVSRGLRPEGGNPHAAGTRAMVLWETSYHARLIYLAERRSPRTVDLAASIARIRAQHRGDT
jgi:hypothetical protein